MFNQLSGRLADVFKNLGGRGVLSENDVANALREVRIALLEADVALPVVKEFIDSVKEKAIGQDVLKSIQPSQQVIKIVHDALVDMLGTDNAVLNFNTTPPAIILMAGLQGSGKTTSTAKLALHLKTKERKKVMVASLDTQRPAAQDQLRILAEQIDVLSLPIVAGENPLQITRRAMQAATAALVDVLLLDTAGRLSIDDELMAEIAAVRDASKPIETLLVADSLIGQDAVNTAKNFHDRIGITGIILTRMDGDGRGGAALSMRRVTGQPIKFIGVGEKMDALDAFHPARVAGRILGMGDIVALVERAAENIDQAEAEKTAAKMMAGKFDLNDLLQQLRQMKKMGGIQNIIGLLPGMGQLGAMVKDKVNDKDMARQEAIILSMTIKERQSPDIIKASRKQRIAAGAGVGVHDVNKLLKQFDQMADMMKRMKKMGGEKGLMRHGLQALMPRQKPGRRY